MLKSLAILAFLFLLPVSSFAFQYGQIVIITQKGEQHFFQVEVASTQEERSQGLMFRPSLPPFSGMLFLFPEEASVGFWMKNTLIPLDMIFISRDGRVMQIAKNTEPQSERIIHSLGPIQSVLEINGGLSDQLTISPGDTVIFRPLQNN